MRILSKIFQRPSAEQAPAGEDALAFHTLFGEEFRGDTAEQVVGALYQNSKEGMGDISFGDWWEYQRSTWKSGYGFSLPDHDKPGAPGRLLDIMLKVGALEKGPLPQEGREAKPGGREPPHG